MRSVAVRNRRVEERIMPGGKRTFVHLIEAEDIIREFTASSRLNADWKFLTKLFHDGRARADEWLAANFDRIGIESTVDSRRKVFLTAPPDGVALSGCCSGTAPESIGRADG